MKKNIILRIAVILSIFMGVIGFTSYNGIQKSEEIVFNAWGDLDASLQRRADLIPNLVSTVKGYANFESSTLEAVIEARAKATAVHLDLSQLSNSQQVQKFALAQQELHDSLAKLLVVVERYPDLKANQNFLDLQHQLEGTENRINFARKEVNAVTRDFNYAIRKFPGAVVNNLFLHLEKKEFFKADAAAQQVVNVDFSQS